MFRFRAYPILFCAVALAITACGGEDPPGSSGGSGGGQATGGSGGDDPGPGGSGGAGGEGGAGGSGGEGSLPEVDSFSPSETGRGFRVRVIGRNFHTGAPKNSVLFTSQKGGTVPNLEVQGVLAAADGTWFEVIVPMGAHSGPTRVLVDSPVGRVTLEGPTFTVTDAALPPSVTSVEPSTFTASVGNGEITIQGKNFYRERTTVTVGESPAVVDWSRSNETTLVATLPESVFNFSGSYSLFVENPAPEGGRAGPFNVKIVEPLRLVSVEAFDPLELRATFDRPVRSFSVSSRNFSIEGVPDPFRFAQRMQSNHAVVRLTLEAPLEPAANYTLVVSPQVTSAEGGALADDRKEFLSFDPRRELLEEIGGPGCGPTTFSDPTGIVLANQHLYVVERGGNQIQVLDRDGGFLGFYGDDGNSFGYHETGSEPGCVGGTPGPDALSMPEGRVVVTLSGAVLVGDSGNGRVVAFTETGAEVLVGELPTPAVLMGLIPGKGIAVTTGPGSLEIFHTGTGASVEAHGGEPGSKRGEMDFTTDLGGIPDLTIFHSFGRDRIALVEPGNHRVSQWSIGDMEMRGSVGSGSSSFSGNADGQPGVEPGTFTGPTGIAANSDSRLYIVDSEGGDDGGGRLQVLGSDGRLNWTMKLDYLPGGVALDEGAGILWITNRSRNTLMKYRL